MNDSELAQKQAEAARPVRHDAIPNHHHNWIAVEWKHGFVGSSGGFVVAHDVAKQSRVTKLYCPDCKETQEVQL